VALPMLELLRRRSMLRCRRTLLGSAQRAKPDAQFDATLSFNIY
jgi:hypothetical protein